MKLSNSRIYFGRIIALVCVLCLLCPCLFSCTKPTEEKELTFSFEFDSSLGAYKVVGIGDYTDKDLVIPSQYNNKAVAAVGSYAFWGCRQIWSVKIEDGLKTIENDAFSDCYHIAEIFLPRSLRLISDYAFNNCTSLLSIFFEGTCDEWIAIEKGENWDVGTPNYTVYCSDGNLYKK